MRPRPERGALLTVAGALSVLVLLEILLVRSQASLATWIWYVVPTVALGAAAVVTAAGSAGSSGSAVSNTSSGRMMWFREIVTTVGMFAAGAAAPIALWALFYASQGALGDLIRGVVILPTVRFATTAYPPPALLGALGALVPVTLLVAVELVAPLQRAWLVRGSALAAVTLLLAWKVPVVYMGVWLGVSLMVPLVVVTGAWVLARASLSDSHRSEVEPARSRSNPHLAAVLWAPAVFTLVQFPWAGPVYMAYVAPLGALALFAVLAAVSEGGVVDPKRGAGPMLTVICGLLIAFTMIGPHRGGLLGPEQVVETRRLEVPRGGIRIPVAEAEELERLVAVVTRLTTGDYVFGTPDVPELYFLSGLENPTRTLFDAFAEQEGRTARVLALLAEHEVEVIVLNTQFTLSDPPIELIQTLELRYPNATRIGRFIVRWRADGA